MVLTLTVVAFIVVISIVFIAVNSNRLLKKRETIEKAKVIKLIDAHALHLLHKYSFKIPSNEEISLITKGDFLKVGYNNERFYCEVLYTEKELNNEKLWSSYFLCRVDNDIIMSSEIKYNDIISVKNYHIMAIVNKDEITEWQNQIQHQTPNF